MQFKKLKKIIKYVYYYNKRKILDITLDNRFEKTINEYFKPWEKKFLDKYFRILKYNNFEEFVYLDCIETDCLLSLSTPFKNTYLKNVTSLKPLGFIDWLFLGYYHSRIKRLLLITQKMLSEIQFSNNNYSLNELNSKIEKMILLECFYKKNYESNYFEDQLFFAQHYFHLQKNIFQNIQKNQAEITLKKNAILSVNDSSKTQKLIEKLVDFVDSTYIFNEIFEKEIISSPIVWKKTRISLVYLIYKLIIDQIVINQNEKLIEQIIINNFKDKCGGIIKDDTILKALTKIKKTNGNINMLSKECAIIDKHINDIFK